jgi:diketogulonate reductase-like aldo/keto reductase/flavodoxin
MKKHKIFSFSAAIYLVCLLTMTSCSAVEIPAAGGGTVPNNAKLTSESQPASAFSDVPADAWYAEAIAYCQQNGVMSGTSDTTFAPEAVLTRAMLAAVLHRMSDTPAVSDSPVFTDAVAGSWYSDAVSWAAKTGVVSGYGGGTFGVNDPATREQAVTILWRYAGEPENAAAADISDMSSISSWAQAAVRWAGANGILDGMLENNRFEPKTNIKRGEVASMLYHYLSSNTSGQPEPAAGGKTLVAYFSATNTTRPLAEYASDILSADLYEIIPEIPYTDADLAYYTNGRADREQNDPAARPGISGRVENMADYDVIFLGYPIWHGQAPRIISTFLESYDLTGKTIVPFCTSHSSGIGSSDTGLHSLASGANWLAGRRFAGGTDRNTVEEWISGLDLPEPEAADAAFNFETKSVTLNSGYEMPINGLGTYSLHGEACVSSVKSALASGVRLIDTASAYGNEEEVGQAVREAMEELGLQREDIFVITKIYPGSEMASPEQSIQACLDRLDLGYVDMMLLHHPDRNDVKAYQAMEKFVEEGKIRSLGLSNWYVKELEEFLPQVSIAPALVQNEIHPYYQENDVIPYIQDLGIVVQGWYPLGGRGYTAELLGDEAISGIAKAHGVSSAQVILRWNLQKGVAVIPGSSNPDHIKENTELYDFELADEEMAQINALDRNEKHDWY